MVLDNETQRKMLLQLIGSVQFSGAAIDEAYALKKSIVEAKIEEQKPADTTA